MIKSCDANLYQKWTFLMKKWEYFLNTDENVMITRFV